MIKEAETILVVDDLPANMGVLFEFLTGQGFKVLVAQNGESALQKAQDAQPDIILLDVMMPGMDGYETCRLLKQGPSTKRIPVIFMTALSDTPFAVKGFKCGGVDYLVKPIQQEEVLARVNTHLEIARSQRILADKNVQLEIEISERKKVEHQLAEANRKLQHLASSDGLTNVANRRRFDEYLAKQWQLAAREKTHLSLLMCDIDFFKPYNDTYGHVAGDQILKTVAHQLDKTFKRPTDLLARYGGEEFAIILPNTDEAGAILKAEDVRTVIEQLQMMHESSLASQVLTCSVGVCSTIPDLDHPPVSLIASADRALYAAKHGGRNQCKVAIYTTSRV